MLPSSAARVHIGGAALPLLLVFVAAVAVLNACGGAAYDVADCVVTLTAEDTGPWGVTNVLLISDFDAADAAAALAALDTALGAGCAAWTLAGGGLWIHNADALLDHIE